MQRPRLWPTILCTSFHLRSSRRCSFGWSATSMLAGTWLPSGLSWTSACCRLGFPRKQRFGTSRPGSYPPLPLLIWPCQHWYCHKWQISRRTVCRNSWQHCGGSLSCRKSHTRKPHDSIAARNILWMVKWWCLWFGTWLVSIPFGHCSRWPVASLQLAMWCLTLKRTRRGNPWTLFGFSLLPTPPWHFDLRSLTSTMPLFEVCFSFPSLPNSWPRCIGMLWAPVHQPSLDSSVARSWLLWDPSHLGSGDMVRLSADCSSNWVGHMQDAAG